MSTPFCNLHQIEFHHFEKNGKDWWAHKNADGSYCNYKEGEQRRAEMIREPVKQPDWEAIAEGKVRHGVIVAAIEHDGLLTLTEDMVAKAERYVRYIMDGPKHQENDEIE